MHATVVVFPGSNADAEMIRTLRDVVGLQTSVAWHRDTVLPGGTDLVVIPGGFSYGDYLRAGAIARVSPIIAAVRQHADQGGLVLGVCNGFQILTEAGLLPGALTQNRELSFCCHDVHLTTTGSGPFIDGLPPTLRIPVAHAEGRYQANAATLDHLETEGLVAFKYCDESGQVTEASNPNGSARSIAGVQGGKARNVLGLMPHPERMSEPTHGGTDGRKLFEAVVANTAEKAAAAAVGAG